MNKLASSPTKSISHRNVGIDLLRVVAAFYVIILHILGIGGLAASTEKGSLQYFLCSAMLIWAFCAVNLFGIISGYVGYTQEERPHKFRNYLNLWLEVMFYNVLLTLLPLWLLPGVVKTTDIVVAFFPFLRGGYWYFSAYTGLFLFIPLLNAAVRNTSNTTLLRLLALIVFVFSPIESLFGSFHCQGGYSFVWLVVLYLVGAILKKTQFGANIHPVAAFSGIIGIVLISFLLSKQPFEKEFLGILFSTSIVEYHVYPGYLLIAILYVLLFSQFRFPKPIQKIISLAAPGAFAVYLINTHRIVWNYYMYDHFTLWASNSLKGILARVLLTATVFVIVSLIVDYLRRQLFRLFQRRRA